MIDELSNEGKARQAKMIKQLMGNSGRHLTFRSSGKQTFADLTVRWFQITRPGIKIIRYKENP